MRLETLLYTRGRGGQQKQAMFVRTVAQACLAVLFVASQADAFTAPGSLVLGRRSAITDLVNQRKAVTARNNQAVKMSYGREQFMQDEEAAKLSRRKLVLGASALAAFIASGGVSPQSADAAYVAGEGARLRGTILQGDPFNGALRYSDFMPKLYNLCKSLGFAPGNILPSRAFCSDENQIYAVMQITKHFGVPPFDHGRVAGNVATDRHGPHAGHGKDLVLIQASHVGYEGDASWGKYRRLVTPDKHISTSCGMVAGTLAWYQKQYEDAQERIRVAKVGGRPVIRIPVYILDNDKKEGFFVNLKELVEMGPNGVETLGRNNQYQEFPLKKSIAAKLESKMGGGGMKPDPAVAPLGNYDDLDSIAIGGYLTANTFYFKKSVLDRGEPGYFLERHLFSNIQEILTSSAPFLTAAITNSALEYERTARTLIKNPLYKGKKVLFVSGVNVDVSPGENDVAILGDTIFLPIAGMMMDDKGKVYNLQQSALAEALAKQPAENPTAIDLEAAVKLTAASQKESRLAVNSSCGCPSCVCKDEK